MMTVCACKLSYGLYLKLKEGVYKKLVVSAAQVALDSTSVKLNQPRKTLVLYLIYKHAVFLEKPPTRPFYLSSDPFSNLCIGELKTRYTLSFVLLYTSWKKLINVNIFILLTFINANMMKHYQYYIPIFPN